MKMAVKVTAIRLQNFMGYVDTDWVEFRPITLLFGSNSSGKSAFIRAILLLRQSLQPSSSTELKEQVIGAGRQREPLNFIADNGVDLGSFWQMIHAHTPYVDLEDQKAALKQMVFGFRCQIVLNAFKEIDGKFTPSNDLFVDLYLNFQLNEQSRVELSAITVELSRIKEGKTLESRVILLAELLTVYDWRGWYFSNHFQKNDELYYTTDTKFLAENPDDPRIIWKSRFRVDSSSGFLPTIFVEVKTKITESIESIFRQCCESIRDWLSDEKFWRLGPIRSAPRRTFRPSELSQHKWDASGESAILDFIQSYNPESETQKKINRSFEYLTIGKKIEVLPLTPQTPPYSEATPDAFQILVFKDGESRGVNLIEIGYGASQIFPIVLKVWYSPASVFGITEQPELHLHPKAQAELADLFIMSVNETRENASLPTRCYLVETHSEHLILRILRRIRETADKHAESELISLTPKDVQVIYIRREATETKLHKLAIKTDGDFVDKWPDGFFDERAEELF